MQTFTAALTQACAVIALFAQMCTSSRGVLEQPSQVPRYRSGARMLHSATAPGSVSGCPDFDRLLRAEPLPPDEDKEFLGPFARVPPRRPPDCNFTDVRTGAEYVRIVRQPTPRVKFIRLKPDSADGMLHITSAGMPHAPGSIIVMDGNNVTLTMRQPIDLFDAGPFNSTEDRVTCVAWNYQLNTTQPPYLPCSLLFVYNEAVYRECYASVPGYGEQLWESGPVPDDTQELETGKVVHAFNTSRCCMTGRNACSVGASAAQQSASTASGGEAASRSAAQQSGGGSALSAGAIAGIVLGCLAVAALVVILLCCCCVMRKHGASTAAALRSKHSRHVSHASVPSSSKLGVHLTDTSKSQSLTPSDAKASLSGGLRGASPQKRTSASHTTLLPNRATRTSVLIERYAGSQVYVSETAPPLVASAAAPGRNHGDSGARKDSAGLSLADSLALTAESAAPAVEPRSDAGGSRRHALLCALLQAADACIDQQLPFAGRYIFVSEAVEGGQALVHMARSASGAFQQFAIKFFLHRGHFEVEAALYAQPAIAATMPPVIQACSNADGAMRGPGGFQWPPFIVTERGAPLAQWLRQPRPRLAILLMMRDVADKLAQLHAAGYTHRDLKPDNLLWLIHTQTWCLLDLGIAATTGKEATVWCTEHYAAPEVLMARASQSTMAVSSAQDIWALGTIVYEALTGERAMPASSGAAKACAEGEQKYAWEANASSQLADVSARRLLMACLARDPARRPAATDVCKEVDSMGREGAAKDALEARFSESGAAAAQPPVDGRGRQATTS